MLSEDVDSIESLSLPLRRLLADWHALIVLDKTIVSGTISERLAPGRRDIIKWFAQEIVHTDLGPRDNDVSTDSTTL